MTPEHLQTSVSETVKKYLLRSAAVFASLYLVSFACMFELLSSPVRTDVHGWLGPARRVDPQITDIGKVFYYEGADLGAYFWYRPLCVVWIWIHGLD